MNDIYFCVSPLLLLLSAIICFAWNCFIHIRRLTKNPIINPMNVFSVSVFIVLLITFMPNAHETHGNFAVALVSAFMDAVDSISFGNSLKDMNVRVFGNVENLFESTGFVHRLYVSFLSLLAPILGARAVFLVFRDLFTQLRFSLNRKNSFHVFSELNEKSVIAAKDIASNDKKAKIIFCSAGNNISKNIYIEQARAMNAMLTKKSIVSFRISDKFSFQKVCFYFIDEDEKNNTRIALDKIKTIKKIKRDVVFLVFSSSESSECVIDIASKTTNNKHIRIDSFDEAQRTAYNLVFEHPIYDVDEKNGKINIMILGASSYGTEFAKAVSWCSQMINQKFDIKFFDKQNKEDFIGFPFTDLGTKLKNIGTELNAEFIVCDIFSKKFNFLRFEKADYIFISLGEDELNIKAALLMKKLYSRKITGFSFSPSDNSSPKIILHIKNTETKRIVEALNDPHLIPYGTLNDVFSGGNIYNWKIDRIAEFIHSCYYCHIHRTSNTATLETFKKGILDYRRQDELSKRSSRATAVHCKYKFHDIGLTPTEENLLSEKSAALIDSYGNELLRAEHDRWNVFQMLDGWEPWDKNSLAKNVHKNKVGKLHAYLAEFNDLKNIAESIYGNGIDPVEYDRVITDSVRFAYLYGECEKNQEEIINNYLKFQENKNEKI